MENKQQAKHPEVADLKANPPEGSGAAETSLDMGEFLKGNTATLLVWLVFLALGGGILALYYSRIHYLPDIEWSSSIVYLAVASFIGGGVGIFFALSLLLPGLIWAECLLCDPELGKFFRFHESGSELCIRTILLYLGTPFGVILLVSHIALKADVIPLYLGTPFGVILLISHIALKADVIVGSVNAGIIVYFVIAAALLGITFLVMWFVFKRICSELKKGRSETKNSKKHSYKAFATGKNPPIEPASNDPTDSEYMMKRRIFKYSVWFTFSVLLSQISMLVLYRLSGGPGGLDFIFLTVICTSAVLISNHVVALRYGHHPMQAVAASLVAAMVLLFVADQFSSLSEGIMSSYGFGRDHKVNLIVTEEGLKIIKELGLADQGASEILYDVEILSKVGGEYYLRIGRSNGSADKTFMLPKTAVRSFISTDDKAR